MGQRRPHLYPTHKWWATQISATSTLAVAWVSAGHWGKPLSIAAIGLVSQAAVGYLVPNAAIAARPQAATSALHGDRKQRRERAASVVA